MTLLAILGIFALLALSSIWRGYVLSVLWNWFTVPLFHLPALNIPYAIGVALVVGFLTQNNNKESSKTDWTQAILLSLLYPLLVLFIGWVVKFFI